MTIAVASLTELDQTLVDQQRVITAQLVLELNPSLDTRRGPFHDLVIQPGAVLAAARQTEMDRLRQSSSLKLINENPTLADSDTVDATMSNYRLTRKAGLQATGNVTIIVSTLATASVPSGAIFEAKGQQFQATTAFIARTTPESVQTTSDRLLTPLSDGTYAFTISVVAISTGDAGMITKDTLLTPQFAILNYIKAFATSDFSGGRSEETNAELANRALAGVAAETASNRVTMTTAILSQEAFADILNSSIVGYGDSEQIRDQHSIIPVSFGGRVDWYIRSNRLPTKVTLTLAATLIQKTVDGKGIWQVTLGRDDQPGYYDTISIVPEGITNFGGSYPIQSEQRSVDLTVIPGELLPDIKTGAEGAFSRYQTSVIQFKDTDTDTTSLIVNTSKQNYDVTARRMLLIEDVQSYVSSRSFRYRGGDILVRAAIPCFVSLSFTIEGPANYLLPDANLLATDLADYINTLGFAGKLYASSLADIVKNQIGSELNVSAIDMFGQILRPNGTIKTLRSTERIDVPFEPENMVSGRTVVFICDPVDIAISAMTVNVPQIL